MQQQNPPSNTGTLGTGYTKLTHRGADENLDMNKYHILLVVERLLSKPKTPTFEHVLIPFALFLGTLLTLLPSDFRDYVGIQASTWEAFALMLTILSLGATIALFVLWLRNKRKNPTKTAEQIVEDICDQMAKDRERASQSREEIRDS